MDLNLAAGASTLVTPGASTSPTTAAHKEIRFNLYRRFTFLSEGKLGWKERIETPACVEDIIKDEFPNNDPREGDYTCFRITSGIDEDMM